MKIIMSIAVIHDRVQQGNLLGAMRKEFDSSVIPIPGMEVEDPVWESPTKINNVTVSFEDDYYYVSLEPLRIKDAKEYDQIKEMYKGHDWKIYGE